jgi:hypothetical protein
MDGQTKTILTDEIRVKHEWTIWKSESNERKVVVSLLVLIERVDQT